MFGEKADTPFDARKQPHRKPPLHGHFANWPFSVIAKRPLHGRKRTWADLLLGCLPRHATVARAGILLSNSLTRHTRSTRWGQINAFGASRLHSLFQWRRTYELRASPPTSLLNQNPYRHVENRFHLRLVVLVVIVTVVTSFLTIKR